METLESGKSSHVLSLHCQSLPTTRSIIMMMDGWLFQQSKNEERATKITRSFFPSLNSKSAVVERRVRTEHVDYR
jgi:hypothetical protein